MFYLRAIAVMIALAASASAAELKIVGPANINVGSTAFLRLEGVKQGEPFDYFATPTSASLVVLFDVGGSPVGVLNGEKPGSFTIVGVAFDAEGKKIVRALHTITVGTPTPIPPGPVPPDPPGPTPDVPPDQFGNAGQLAHKLTSGLSATAKGQSKAIATIYRQAADKLSDGSFVNVTVAHQWITAERSKVWGVQAAEWQPVIDELGKVWNKFWPMDKATVILFYRAVAGGWEAVR